MNATDVIRRKIDERRRSEEKSRAEAEMLESLLKEIAEDLELPVVATVPPPAEVPAKASALPAFEVATEKILRFLNRAGHINAISIWAGCDLEESLTMEVLRSRSDLFEECMHGRVMGWKLRDLDGEAAPPKSATVKAVSRQQRFTEDKARTAAKLGRKSEPEQDPETEYRAIIDALNRCPIPLTRAELMVQLDQASQSDFDWAIEVLTGRGNIFERSRGLTDDRAKFDAPEPSNTHRRRVHYNPLLRAMKNGPKAPSWMAERIDECKLADIEKTLLANPKLFMKRDSVWCLTGEGKKRAEPLALLKETNERRYAILAHLYDSGGVLEADRGASAEELSEKVLIGPHGYGLSPAAVKDALDDCGWFWIDWKTVSDTRGGKLVQGFWRLTVAGKRAVAAMRSRSEPTDEADESALVNADKTSALIGPALRAIYPKSSLTTHRIAVFCGIQAMEAVDVLSSNPGLFTPLGNGQWELTEEGERKAREAQATFRPSETGTRPLRILQMPKDAPKETPEEAPASDPHEPSHSTSFATVNWFGEIYYFTPKQRLAIAELWKGWEEGRASYGRDLLKISGCTQKAIGGLFANRKHPAWGTMIRFAKDCGQGMYELHDSSKAEVPPMPKPAPEAEPDEVKTEAKPLTPLRLMQRLTVARFLQETEAATFKDIARETGVVASALDHALRTDWFEKIAGGRWTLTATAIDELKQRERTPA